MTYRVRRHTTSQTFKVNGQLCKVFLEPCNEYLPGFWAWNVGFAIGKSKRQINDWYWKRKNKRWRSLNNQLTGRNGIKAIKEGFNAVLRMRWNIEPGDCIMLDCTSKEPDKQFKAWLRWHKKHPEWLVDFVDRKFYWYRPPYSTDEIWNQFKIEKVTPEDPLANTLDLRYFDSFRIHPKVQGTPLSMNETMNLLSQVLSIDLVDQWHTQALLLSLNPDLPNNQEEQNEAKH